MQTICLLCLLIFGITLMLDHTVFPHLFLFSFFFLQQGNTTPLHQAVLKNMLEVVRVLSEHGASVDAVDEVRH